MSWVSILEDAIERFESDLHLLKKEGLPDASEVSAERLRDIRLIIARGEAILYDALKHLDVATDPALDIAAALNRTIEDQRQLEAKIWEYDKTCRSLKAKLDQEHARADVLQRAFDEMKVEKNRLERKLEEVMRANPGAVYAAYGKCLNKK